MKTAVIIFSVIVTFISCSSAPKNKGDIFILRTNAETLLEAGNKEASRGNFENALIIVNEGKRNAILSDDPSVIVRSSLLRGNILFALGRTEEAFSEWDQAVSEAQRSGNSELVSICRIFYARGMLMSDISFAQSALDIVNSEQSNIRSDRLFIASSWQVKGLALRALGSYSEAENAISYSLEIHEKNMYLENASYDWYTIASIRSLAGNTQGALNALESSIAIDRRIENSWGLAASWRAMGDVLRKVSREEEALDAYNRAIAIYRAMGNDAEADQTERRMLNSN